MTCKQRNVKPKNIQDIAVPSALLHNLLALCLLWSLKHGSVSIILDIAKRSLPFYFYEYNYLRGLWNSNAFRCFLKSYAFGSQALEVSISALSGTVATTSVEAPFSSDVVSDAAVSLKMMDVLSPSAAYASSASTPFDFSREGSHTPEFQHEKAAPTRLQRIKRYLKVC